VFNGVYENTVDGVLSGLKGYFKDLYAVSNNGEMLTDIHCFYIYLESLMTRYVTS